MLPRLSAWHSPRRRATWWGRCLRPMPPSLPGCFFSSLTFTYPNVAEPQSALALWFEERVRRNGGRLKKTTIVALARKLLVALWKYVTAGVVIEGALMKAA